MSLHQLHRYLGDLWGCRSEDRGGATWGMDGAGDEHNSRGYSTRNCTCYPFDLFEIRAETEEFRDTDPNDGREGVAKKSITRLSQW